MKLSRETEASRFLHITYQFLNTGSSIQGSKFKCKTPWANTGKTVASARERRCFYSDSGSSHKLFVVHRAGIRAALTISFIVKMGQKENVTKCWRGQQRMVEQTALEMQNQSGWDSASRDADPAPSQHRAWAGVRRLTSGLCFFHLKETVWRRFSLPFLSVQGILWIYVKAQFF